jgi:hypothetical protein
MFCERHELYCVVSKLEYGIENSRKRIETRSELNLFQRLKIFPRDLKIYIPPEHIAELLWVVHSYFMDILFSPKFLYSSDHGLFLGSSLLSLMPQAFTPCLASTKGKKLDDWPMSLSIPLSNLAQLHTYFILQNGQRRRARRAQPSTILE